MANIRSLDMKLVDDLPAGACARLDDEDYIAGWNKRAAWQAMRARLVLGQPNGWAEAFTDFYKQRLDLRYLNPIRVMQEHGTFTGEGFAIAAVQCTLIEFLESTEQGINYVYGRPGPFEYCKSGPVFVSFLTERQPFKGVFTKVAAVDFYQSVRCGLLHEAQTKNGWRIWGGNALQGQYVDVANKIVNRDKFQAALLAYIADYGVRLPNDHALQAALLRKFDSL
jgi:hypothetical protein